MLLNSETFSIKKLLPLFVLFFVVLSCGDQEKYKADQKMKVAKEEVVEKLKKEFDRRDDCMVNFWMSGDRDEVLVAFICAGYWDRGVSFNEILTPQNAKLIKSAGFEVLEVDRKGNTARVRVSDYID